MTLQLPAAFTLPAGKTEDTQEFVLETARDRDRFIDGRRSAAGQSRDRARRDHLRPRCDGARETVLATWLPGSTPVSAGAGIGFLWRAGEQLGVRIHYKKTWKLENKPASDRSTVGLYLSNAPARDVRRFDLTARERLEEDAQALAVVALRNPRRAVRRGRAHRGGTPRWFARADRRFRRRARDGISVTGSRVRSRCRKARASTSRRPARA